LKKTKIWGEVAFGGLTMLYIFTNIKISLSYFLLASDPITVFHNLTTAPHTTRFAMSTSTASVQCIREITLRVSSPLSGANGTKINSPSCPSYGIRWEVTLTRADKFLDINVAYYHSSHLDYSYYKSMLILPHGEYESACRAPLSGVAMAVNNPTFKSMIMIK
jgi:hypothetical protein